MKHTPPPLLFPVRSCDLSARCTENPGSCIAESGTLSDSQVSVRQITQQSRISRWNEIRARSSHSLFSRDCTLASNKLGNGGLLVRRLSRTRTPDLLPLRRRLRPPGPENKGVSGEMNGGSANGASVLQSEKGTVKSVKKPECMQAGKMCANHHR